MKAWPEFFRAWNSELCLRCQWLGREKRGWRKTAEKRHKQEHLGPTSHQQYCSQFFEQGQCQKNLTYGHCHKSVGRFQEERRATVMNNLDENEEQSWDQFHPWHGLSIWSDKFYPLTTSTQYFSNHYFLNSPKKRMFEWSKFWLKILHTEELMVFRQWPGNCLPTEFTVDTCAPFHSALCGQLFNQKRQLCRAFFSNIVNNSDYTKKKLQAGENFRSNGS